MAEQCGAVVEKRLAEANGCVMIAERIASGVGGHIRKDGVKEAGRIAGALKERLRRGGCEIAMDCYDVWLIEVMFDGLEVDADDKAGGADAFGSDLHPTAGGSAAIENAIAGAEDSLLLIDFNELVGGAGEVAFFFGEMEVVVLDVSHDEELPDSRPPTSRRGTHQSGKCQSTSSGLLTTATLISPLTVRSVMGLVPSLRTPLKTSLVEGDWTTSLP